MHDAALVSLTGLALILLGLTVRTHWRAGNTGTLLLIFWLSIGNLIFFVNTAAWWDRYDNRAPVWCDISSKLQVGFATGLAGSTLSITRRLASIAASRVVTADRRQLRHTYIIDLSVGVGLPIIVMALSYIVQPHRFDILEGYGCDGYLYPCLPTIFIVQAPPIILSLVSACYGAVALRFFLRRRLEFNTLLKNSNSGLDRGHYIRLMLLSSSDLFISLPLEIYYFVAYAQALLPWTSWADIHLDWSYVGRYKVAAYVTSTATFCSVVFIRYLPPLLAFIVFLYFGVSDEAVSDYLRLLRGARSRWTRKNRSSREAASFIPALGSKIAKPTSEWDKAESMKDEPAQPFSPVLGASNPLSLSVAVQVERQTV